MKKDRFLWSAHRITERQKAGKARNIKEKQLKNSRSTVSKQLVALRSSASVNFGSQRDNRLGRENAYKTSETLCFWGFLSVYIESPPVSAYNKRQCVKK